MEPTSLVETLVAFLGPALAAAMAAYLAVRWALVKYSGEKAFDRRLEWYEEAIHAIQAFGASLNLIAIAVREDWPADRQSPLVDDMIKQRGRMTQVIATAALYAKSESVVQIMRLTQVMAAEINPTPGTGPDGHPGYRIDLEGIETVADQCGRVSAELTKELRRHLGLEELTASDAASLVTGRASA